MSTTLAELAKLTESSYRGDANTVVDTAASLIDAVENQVSFVSNPKYVKQLDTTKASIVILSEKMADTFSGNVLVNNDPYLTFARVVDILYPENKPKKGIHPSAVIAKNTKIHESASIGAHAVIEQGVNIAKNVRIDAGCFIGENVKIAESTHIYPNVTIYNDTEIGAQSRIHSCAVIGADGFGFAPKPDKSWYKIRQVGHVEIGNHVEIGASTTVDRATLGVTIISDGVKLDNQIQIGHNVYIGEHTAIASGALIAGSTSIGKHCQIGGASAIAGHINIADDVIITGGSLVIKSIKTAGVYSSGVTTEKNTKWRRNSARFRSLDEMAKRMSTIEKKLNEK